MPTLAELDHAMLQLARAVPAVRRLGGGAIALTGPGHPFRVLGRHAAVYQLNQPSGGVLALRCPLGDVGQLDPLLADRYRALVSDLAVAPLRRSGGPLLSGLAYYADGMTLPTADFRSATHPVMVMEWVKGPTLLAAVERACQAADTGLLAALTESWAAAIARIVQSGFSHGDLTADNVMVRPGGEIALVDYDTVVWPEAAFARAAASGRAAIGDPLPPGYAHPAGMPAPLEQRDDYPALVIYASLQVLTRWPQLREKFGDPASRIGGVLLFAAADLVDPERSPLIRAIQAENDPLVSRVMTSLIRASTGPVTAVPPLHEVVAEARMIAARRVSEPPRRRADWQPERLSSRTEAWPAAPRREADRTQPLPPAPRETTGHGWAPPAPPPTWAAPARPERRPPAAPEPGGARAARPLAGQPEGETWRRSTADAGAALDRQRKLTQLNSLLLNGDEAAAERFWHDSGLAGDAEAERELGSRIADIPRRRYLAQARAAAEAGDAAAFLRAWNEGQLAGYPPAAPLGHLFDRARQESAGPARLQAALAANDVSAVRAAWSAARTDPRAAIHAVRVQTLVAGACHTAISAAMRRNDDDALLASLAEAATAGVPLEAPMRQAGVRARARRATRRELAAALAADDRRALAALALSGQLGDLGPIEAGTQRAIKRAVAWPHLERAFAADDDAEIRATYDASLFDDPVALTPAQRARVDLARRRLGWLAQVRQALRQRDLGGIRAALNATPAGAERFLTAVERQRLTRLAAAEPA